MAEESSNHPAIQILNRFIVKRMLNQLGLPQTDDVDLGRQMVLENLKNDLEAIEQFQSKFIQKISHELISSSSGESKDLRSYMEGSLELESLPNFESKHSVSSSQQTPSD